MNGGATDHIPTVPTEKKVVGTKLGCDWYLFTAGIVFDPDDLTCKSRIDKLLIDDFFGVEHAHWRWLNSYCSSQFSQFRLEQRREAVFEFERCRTGRGIEWQTIVAS
jgi:hypothetical protein